MLWSFDSHQEASEVAQALNNEEVMKILCQQAGADNFEQKKYVENWIKTKAKDKDKIYAIACLCVKTFLYASQTFVWVLVPVWGSFKNIKNETISAYTPRNRNI